MYLWRFCNRRIEARACAIAPRFMSSKRRNQLRRVFETARTKARSIEVDVLNVCLSKRSLCRLGRLTFEIRRAAPVVVHFVIRLRKSSRLNQFVALAYSRRCRKMYDVRARNLVHLTFVSFWFIASRSKHRLYYLIMKNKPLRDSLFLITSLGIERIMNNQ